MRLQRTGVRERTSRIFPMLLAAFIASLWSCGALAADPTKGRELYAQHCRSCHGADGSGQFPGMPDFSRGDGLFRPDIELVRTIRAGRGMMPAYEGLLTEQELLDVVAYLRTLR